MFQFQNKTISGLLIVSLMLFSFAPQTAYAGGVVNAVVDVVSSVVETVVDVVVDVVKEVMSNPVLGIIVAVAVAYATGYSWGIESGFIEELGVETFAPYFGYGPTMSLAEAVVVNEVTKDVILCVTEVAFCGGDDGNQNAAGASAGGASNAGAVDNGVGANSAKSQQLTTITAGSYGLASPNCSTSGCKCYGPTNSCSQAYQGNIEGDGSSAVCKANGIDLATYAAPPESSCPQTKATLSASPTVIDSGQASTLTWSSTNGATACTWAGGFSNLIVGPSGSVSTGPLTQSSTYQITCANSTETSAPANATITVLNPEVAISADPTRLRAGNSSMIKWSAKDVKSCVISNSAGNTLASGDADADRKFSTGSPVSVTVTNQTIYTITCQTNGDSVKKSVTVNIVTIFEEF